MTLWADIKYDFMKMGKNIIYLEVQLSTTGKATTKTKTPFDRKMKISRFETRNNNRKFIEKFL